MTIKIEIIKAGHTHFAKRRMLLADSALGSPIYRDANSSYYQTVSDQRLIKNLDSGALLAGKLVTAVRLHLAEGKKGQVLDYYGNLGCFLAVPGTAPPFFCSLVFSAISLSVIERGLQTAISSPDVEIDISMSSEWTAEPAKVIDLILRNASKLRPAFSKYLDLRATLSGDQALLPRWPKSVREALKRAE